MKYYIDVITTHMILVSCLLNTVLNVECNLVDREQKKYIVNSCKEAR